MFWNKNNDKQQLDDKPATKRTFSLLSPVKAVFSGIGRIVRKWPLLSILFVFLLLLGVLFGSRFLNPQVQEKKPEPQTKQVSVYTIGNIPRVTFQAKIEKTGVIKIMAQSPGIVQKIAVKEGTPVSKGQSLLYLSTNYQGGNAPAVQTQIASKQYQNVLNSYPDQKDAIQKQRDLANTNYDNAQIQVDIAKQSSGSTNALISASQGALQFVSSSLQSLQNNSVPGTQSDQFKQLSSSIANAKSDLEETQKKQKDLQNKAQDNQLKLASLQRDLTQDQLNVQEKALDLQKEVSRLQVALASIAEANMYPASPIAGVVDRIFVKIGQAISPGTPLAVVSSPNPKSIAVLNVPERIARIISQGFPSELEINNRKYEEVPYYISSEATDGLLYAVFYTIPPAGEPYISDMEFIPISVPVDMTQQDRTDPLVPIDSVYQTQDRAFVLVEKNGKAQSRKVQLGSVVGDYVDVVKGIQPGDKLILDRNVVEGDRVTY